MADSCAMDTSVQPQDSPLFKLPPELREKIYEYAIVDSGPTRVFCRDEHTEAYGLGPDYKDYRWQAPPLLQSCRLVRLEASPAYYSKNRFYIVDGNGWFHWLLTWLRCIGEANVLSLKEARVAEHSHQMITRPAGGYVQFWHDLQVLRQPLSKGALKWAREFRTPPYSEGDTIPSPTYHRGWAWVSLLQMEERGHRNVVITEDSDMTQMEDEPRNVYLRYQSE